jgi:glycosyltransferase 2 family protein
MQTDHTGKRLVVPPDLAQFSKDHDPGDRLLPRPGHRWAVWLLSLAISAGLLFVVLRHVDWAALRLAISGTQFSFLAVAAGIFSVSFLLRGVRWRLLLLAGSNVPVTIVFWANMVGYLGNNFLPARAGELVRAVLVARRSSMSKSFAFGTAITERMLDSLALVLISATAILIWRDVPPWLYRTSAIMGAVGLLGLTAVLLSSYVYRFVLFVVQRSRFLGSALQGRLEYIVAELFLGLQSLHYLRRAALFVALTPMIWFLDGTAAVMTARSMHLDMPLPLALLLLAALGLASAIPSTPGYLGVYQFVALTVLRPFGFSKNNGLAFILVFQALMYAVITCWGLIGLWRLKRGSTQILETQTPPTTTRPE